MAQRQENCTHVHLAVDTRSSDVNVTAANGGAMPEVVLLPQQLWGTHLSL
jgi:hypothetical protein